MPKITATLALTFIAGHVISGATSGVTSALTNQVVNAAANTLRSNANQYEQCIDRIHTELTQMVNIDFIGDNNTIVLNLHNADRPVHNEMCQCQRDVASDLDTTVDNFRQAEQNTRSQAETIRRAR